MSMSNEGRCGQYGGVSVQFGGVSVSSIPYGMRQSASSDGDRRSPTLPVLACRGGMYEEVSARGFCGRFL